MTTKKSVLQSENKPHPINIWMKALALFITLALGIATIYFNNTKRRSPDKFFPISVLADGVPVSGADVGLSLPEINPSRTDTHGQVFFPLKETLVGKPAHIWVRKRGFQIQDQQVFLEPRSDYYVINLERESGPTSIDTDVRRGKAPASRTGDAKTAGDYSPANTGSGTVTIYAGPGRSAEESKKK